MNFIAFCHRQLQITPLPVVYSKLCQTLKMERFTKIVNDWRPLAIFEKRFVLDVSILHVLDLSEILLYCILSKEFKVIRG